MSYATRADIEAIYGPAQLQTLVAADLDLDQAVAAACSSASAEMDAYLARRCRLPLDPVPPILKTWCIDIACWRLAPNIAQLSEEIRKRAERALAILKDIAAGKAEVPGTTATPSGGASEEAEASKSGAAFASRRRRFGGEGGGL